VSEEAIKEIEEETLDQEALEAQVGSDETEESTPPTMEEQLLAAEQQAAEYLDGWQRERAEFANARKRMERQRIDAYRNAQVEVISRLLPIIDDFQRAMDTVPTEINEHSWFEGIQLVFRKLEGILEKENIEVILAVGEEFDPNYHEAVMQEPSEEFASGVVVRELQTGYRLGERVIRPAMVIVAA
jgi:molecular chaperone GrpE